MQFRVVIPAHVQAGEKIRIRCPDGSQGDVKVPKGLKSGDSFVFEMPDMRKQGGGGGGGGGSSNTGNNNSKGGSTAAAAASTTIFSTASSGNNNNSRRGAANTTFRTSFLDREIVSLQDFLMALGVGLLIGFSIVIGFLVGVLYVTDPNYNAHTINLSVIEDTSAAAMTTSGANMIEGQDSDALHQQYASKYSEL